MSFASVSFQLPSLESVLDRHPVVISPDLSVEEAIAFWNRESPYPYLVVSQNQQVLGVITVSDYHQIRTHWQQWRSVSVERVMTPQGYSLTWQPDLDLLAVTKLMYEQQIEYLPILDLQQNIMGVVCAPDLQKSLQGLDAISIYYGLAQLQATHKKSDDRHNIGFQTLLDRTVKEIHQGLKCDRVLIYRFEPDGGGTVIAESVYPLCKSLLSIKIIDSHFGEDLLKAYINGRTQVTHDIESGGLTPCYVEFLRQIQVKANLVVPILQENHLWGLLTAQQAIAPRHWSRNDEAFLKQQADQLAIRLKQSLPFQDLPTQLREHQWMYYTLEQEKNFTHAILNAVDALVVVVNRQGEIIYFNNACQRLSGVLEKQAQGQRFWEFLIPVAEQPQIKQAIGQALQGESTGAYQCHWVIQGSTKRRIEWSNQSFGNLGIVTHAIVTGIDLSRRQEAQIQLRFRDRQQQTLTYLSQYAIATTDLQILMNEIVQQIAKTLSVDYVEILELLPNQAAFQIQAAHGFTSVHYQNLQHSIEQLTLSATKNTQPGYTLWCGQSVVVDDLQIETRFRGSVLHNQGRVISSITTIIPGVEQPFGVLGVHSREHCHFNPDEVQFLEAIAHLLASFLEQHRLTEELNQFFNLSLDLFCIITFDGSFKRINPRFQGLLGYSPHQLQSRSLFDFIHPDDLAATQAQVQQLASRVPTVNFEHRYRCQDGSYRWIAWTAMPSDESYFYAVGRDITERREIEIALKESRKHYVTLATASPVGIFQTDNQGLCLYVNQCWCDITGLSAQEAMMEGWSQTLHPEDLEWVFQEWNEAVEEHRTFSSEYRFQHRDGTVVWVMGQAVADVDEEGNIVGYVGSITNISDRKQAEEALKYLNQTLEDQVAQRTADLETANEALRYAEERFRIALKNSPIIVFNQDLDLRYTWIYNPVLGYTAEGVIGKSDRDLFAPEDAQKLERIKQQALDSQSSVREEVMLADRGDLKCYDLTVDPLLSSENQVIGITCAALDITHRKKAELALQENERFIQRIADASPNILYIYDLEQHKTVYSNKDIALVLGYTPRQIQEMGNIVCEDFLHPEDRPKVVQWQEELVDANNTEIWEIEYRMRDRHGEWHWFVSRDTIFTRNDQGKPIQLLGAASDITERKQVEEQLRLSERAIAASSNGIVIIDAQQPDFPVISVNPAFERVTGYCAQDIIGKNCRILQGTDRQQEGLATIRKALKNEESCTVVLRNYRKNGTLFWNRTTISPIHDDRGILTHYLGIQNNITEIKVAEEHLLAKVKREELFGMITQRIRESLDLQEILTTTVQEVKKLLLSDRVLVYRVLPNYTGQVIAEAVNPGWTETLDKKFPEETFPRECYDQYIAGKTYATSDITQTDIRPCLVEFLQEFQVKSKIVVPIIQNNLLWGLLIVHQCDRIRDWKEEEIEVLKQIASQLAIAIQQSEFYQQLQRELKERIVAETALLMSQERIQYLLSSSPGILYSLRANDSLELTFVSDNAYDVIGYELLEMFEANFWWTHLHPEDQDKISQHGLKSLFDQGFYSHEYRFLHKDGRYIWIYDKLNLVRDEQGNPLEIIGYWIDITDRKRIEQKLQETTSRLTSLISNLQLGVLVKDEHHKVALINQTFCHLFKTTNCSDRLIGQEWGNIGDEFSHLFDRPEEISQHHQDILTHNKIVTNQEIQLADGRILEQNYVPILIDSIDRGHLWMYRDISDRKQAESRLVTSLQEKEILLKEIHHRVKNNLLVVSNLLEFQADYVSDPTLIKVLEDSRNRIYSMALIHEKLYRSMTLDTINFGEYLEDLVPNLFESYNVEENKVRFYLDIEPVLLNIETAHPCGLIVNELLSNTLKHAFPEGTQGKVEVIMYQQDNNQIVVKVADNGIGFPEDLDFRNVDSLGMELVCTLTEQLEGEITLLRDHGTTFELRFSELKYRQRV
ncbi:PAS domain S-box protein [Roseofilum sp. Belize Diploria]|uniref:PAS domain S-box protein n=1 Tax=Roseofilum sp. Belize Diploria TaxID=2821501 RepID=UPI001B192C0C|nr:PAS domain S-box protein [Roseofilum sp. Belize Diploria]MBP0007701.1 PAS domain S-box protein [Roseofilum sp. Belize Diploria]